MADPKALGDEKADETCAGIRNCSVARFCTLTASRPWLRITERELANTFARTRRL